MGFRGAPVSARAKRRARATVRNPSDGELYALRGGEGGTAYPALPILVSRCWTALSHVLRALRLRERKSRSV
ncbi:hypothetical protein [Aminivibrio sp.]|uniref:hypothetical protein n=1 Tax=Aminivibrio sp. TaxID=1872489 RepID=UPI003D96EEC9